MTTTLLIRILLGLVALVLVVGVGWILLLPPPATTSSAPSIPADETEAALNALRPSKRPRPVIAIVGANGGTEMTDYLMPYGILRRADVAEIVALGTSPGPLRLYPAFRVQPQGTTAEFDAQHPEGADYIIVPAMSRDDDPVVLRWIKEQSAKHAIVVGVCAGAKVVAAAGLLDGKRATTHWYYLKELLKKHPSIRYVPDRRLVVDAGVATTTGISASMPMALTLVQAIAGREKAESVARAVGLEHWDSRHDSRAFQFNRSFARAAMRNKLAFWNRDEFAIELAAGIDEVALVLVADAWSRTYRSRATTFSRTTGPVESRNGLLLLPDRVAEAPSADQEQLPGFGAQPPAQALDRTLDALAARYGADTANLVTMQLEYPRRFGEP